jgi:hypothetical protein
LTLIGFGIAWAGYAVLWWGWTTLQGPGIGFMDLITPGRVPGHSSDASSSPVSTALSSVLAGGAVGGAIPNPAPSSPATVNGGRSIGRAGGPF